MKPDPADVSTYPLELLAELQQPDPSYRYLAAEFLSRNKDYREAEARWDANGYVDASELHGFGLACPLGLGGAASPFLAHAVLYVNSSTINKATHAIEFDPSLPPDGQLARAERHLRETQPPRESNRPVRKLKDPLRYLRILDCESAGWKPKEIMGLLYNSAPPAQRYQRFRDDRREARKYRDSGYRRLAAK
jgi:hypothetical protein